ncbi:hypothetical protein [Paenarthrobacter sp. RAF54_2]|uniref:hypothetical protein n=1 Tax=Paenarthrobacter sp. RAF54_2 TaxID=3233061 RepID=UPI003F9A85F7
MDDIIDAVAEKRECDLVEDIAAVLPTRITLELIGVPREDWDYLTEASWQFMSSGAPRWMIDNDPVKTAEHGHRKLLNYWTKLALDRRQNPKDDFATIIGELEIDGDRLSIHETKRWFVALIGRCLETSRNAMAVGMWELMRQSEQREMLRNDPSLTRNAVEEGCVGSRRLRTNCGLRPGILSSEESRSSAEIGLSVTGCQVTGTTECTRIPRLSTSGAKIRRTLPSALGRICVSAVRWHAWKSEHSFHEHWRRFRTCTSLWTIRPGFPAPVLRDSLNCPSSTRQGVCAHTPKPEEDIRGQHQLPNFER